ncbi:hypothetical protein QTH87_06760 [Variovorax sp. J22P168]|uniref:hypothetical protein n=1 Tax=Variovorax jilinensis TaxID=3053513 RepID=UPI0025749FCE|nr:hypothetical protein [Variovorax sp. J22P168]MDM0012140.1 hypothetical protein [Variovorax sp. J22P168]
MQHGFPLKVMAGARPPSGATQNLRIIRSGYDRRLSVGAAADAAPGIPRRFGIRMDAMPKKKPDATRLPGRDDLQFTSSRCIAC